MARSDLLLNLVRAGAHGDKPAFRRTLEAIVADERERQHHVIADRLAEHLAPPNGTSPNGAHRGPGEPASNFVMEVQPVRVLADLVLPGVVRAACAELAEEQHRADLLRSHGIEPRHRLLLVGPPGNGKTSLAEALASELAAPLLVVRYDGIITSYLGETAVRLARLFDHVRTRHCVLFFDEFDAIGKERGDEHETGEVKRVVSSLLLNIDALPSYVVVVAATNHAELLDRAAWRRFQVRMDLPPPTASDAFEWIGKFEKRSGLELGLSRKSLTTHLKGLSFAELEEFCLDVQRRVVLAGPEVNLASIVSTRLAQWRARSAAAR